MPLSETAIRQTKVESRPIKLFDGRGLYLIIKPNGARGWRCKNPSSRRQPSPRRR